MNRGTGSRVPRFVDVLGLVTVTAATERALENIGIGIGKSTTRKSFLWRIYGLSLWRRKGSSLSTVLRFIEHFSVDQGTGSVVPRFVDVFGRLVTVTAATERLLKTSASASAD